MTLETVIATELHPSGLAQVLLSHLIDNEKNKILYGFCFVLVWNNPKQ